MSTHNIGFYEDLTKIIFELSSNTHLISSAGLTGREMLPKDAVQSLVTKTRQDKLSISMPQLWLESHFHIVAKPYQPHLEKTCL